MSGTPPSSNGGSGAAGSGRKRPREDGDDVIPPTDDDDDLVHMDDLLGEHDALYGSSTDTECTYSLGYLPRQPVYACRTCETDGPAAICYGCAKRCHDGHDLLELYSKRGLCCDCGNAKFAGVRDAATGENFACQLCEFKTLNRDNKYNQNFDGLYCICSRPYPDAENSSAEEMLQCAICEDWYHSEHLVMPVGGSGCLSAESCEELVCQLCATRLPYLRHYAQQSDAPAAIASSATPDKQSDNPAGPSDTSTKPSDTPAGSSGGCCYLRDIQSQAVTPAATALLMPSAWRRRLCRCARCLAVYAADSVAFLTEPADSLAEFELANRQAAEEQSRPENVLRSLASAGLPHVSVQLVASAIGDFRRGLTRAMASVLAEKNCGEGEAAVITREDADRILAMMAPLLAKRARFQPPDTCRKD